MSWRASYGCPASGVPARGRPASVRAHGGPALFLAVGLTAVYGGYFGAAQGVILLAILGALLEPDVQRANAIKNLLALVANGVAALLFVFRADVDWAVAAFVAVGSIVGGTLGVRLARRLPPVAFRWFVVLVAVTAALVIVVREVSLMPCSRGMSRRLEDAELAEQLRGLSGVGRRRHGAPSDLPGADVPRGHPAGRRHRGGQRRRWTITPTSTSGGGR